MEDKHWRNVELRSAEEGLSLVKEENLAEAARSYKATTRVGCDGFRPKVLPDMSKETRRQMVKFVAKLKRCERWPQQACTMFFFIEC